MIIAITTIGTTLIIIETNTNVEYVEVEKQIEYFSIQESLKGFNSIDGEGLLLTINISNQEFIGGYFSFFDEELGDYIHYPIAHPNVSPDGILKGSIFELGINLLMYYEDSYNDSKIVTVDVYDGVGNDFGSLYFLTTPIFVIEIQQEEIEKTYAGFTGKELFEIAKKILPLLI